MPVIPTFLLKQLYVKGSLRVVEGNTRFKLKNNLASATINTISLSIDGREVDSRAICVTLRGVDVAATDVSREKPLHFPFDSELDCEVANLPLGPGRHVISLTPATEEIGTVTIEVEDVIE